MPAPKNPNTEPARLALAAKREAAKHKRMASELHLSGEWLVMSRHEVIEMLARPEYRDGFTPAFLRGYLRIEKTEPIEVHANQGADGEA